MTPPKLMPAVLGGAVIGVLSVLPVVNLANCCCIWLITGGVVAAWVMQQNYPLPIAAGDGAVAGLLAGVVGAIIWAILFLPLHAVTGGFEQRMLQQIAERAGDLPPAAQQALERAQHGGAIVASFVIGFVFMLVIGGLLSMLGGLFGAIMFRKGPVTPVPPPPPPPIA
jgi:hypothetical protein